MSTGRHSNDSPNWTLRPPDYFGLLMTLNYQAKKEVTILVGVTDPDYQGKIGLLLYNRGREEYA